MADQKAKYRTFLTTQARFANPMLIEDKRVLQCIELTYRLIFMKDIAAARWIDETTLALINSVGCVCHHASR